MPAGKGLTLLLGSAVMAIAVLVRLWQADLTPFLDDEASLLSRGLALLSTGHIPLAGGSFSIGVREPPLMTFLLAPVLLVSRDPAWVTRCFCCVDAAAALCVCLSARRLGGSFAGFAAGLLYALAPAAIYFTRRTDYYGLVPFFVAFATLCLIRAWQQRSASALAAGFVASAFALQLHPISAMLLPVWLLSAAILARRLSSWRPFTLAAAVVALSLAPYLYLQAQSGWADAAAVARFIQTPKTSDWSSAAQALTLATGGIYQQLLLPQSSAAPEFSVDIAGWLLAILVLAGSLYLPVRQRAWWIVAALVLLPVAAGIRHTSDVLPYYMLPVVVPATILAGGALGAIRWRWLGALLLLAIVAWQASGYVHFQTTVAEQGPDLRYGMPLRYEALAARAIDAPSGSRVFVAQQGNQSAIFPYLTGNRYQISHSDSRYGLALTTEASTPPLYVVQAGGRPYDFLKSHLGEQHALLPRRAAGRCSACSTCRQMRWRYWTDRASSRRCDQAVTQPCTFAPTRFRDSRRERLHPCCWNGPWQAPLPACLRRSSNSRISWTATEPCGRPMRTSGHIRGANGRLVT